MTDLTTSSASHGSFFKKKRPFTKGGSNLSSLESSAQGSSEGLSTFVSAENSRPSTALKGDYNSRTHSRRESSISSISDLKSNLRRRSASLRSRSAHSPEPGNLASSANRSPEKRSASSTGLRPTLTVSTHPSRQRSTETLSTVGSDGDRRPATAVSATERSGSRLGFGSQSLRRGGGGDDSSLRPPPTSHGSSGSLHQAGGAADSDPKSLPGSNATAQSSSANSQNPRMIFQHIQDMASKRISTLDYLRKAHEGRVFWFNTLLFEKTDLAKMPYFDARKVARRATNYLLLGISLPAVLDTNSDNATDYLRHLNFVLTDFDQYQTYHPPDGTAASGLSRTRLPQMFKRSALSSSSKGRRSTSTNDHASSLDSGDHRGGGGIGSAASSTFSSIHEQDLLPGEEYIYLQTPSVPFDPDYFETFASLCDVLIDCYTRVSSLVNSPDGCTPALADLFSKADSRVRKILVTGIAREFEDTSKQGIKSELAGVGKLTLSGLM